MADSTLSAINVFMRVSRLSNTNSSRLQPYWDSMIRSPRVVVSRTSRLDAMSASCWSISTPARLRSKAGGKDHPWPRKGRFMILDAGRARSLDIVGAVHPAPYPPISTVSAPGGMMAPPAALRSATLAAGSPPINTVAEPLTMASTPHVSPNRAAGSPPIKTVGAPGGMMGVGTPDVAALTMKSVIRAAGSMLRPFPCSSVDLHHAALDHGRRASFDRRACRGELGARCSGRLEARLGLHLNVHSLDLDVFRGFQDQILGALDRNAAVIERHRISILVVDVDAVVIFGKTQHV